MFSDSEILFGKQNPVNIQPPFSIPTHSNVLLKAEIERQHCLNEKNVIQIVIRVLCTR